MRTTFPDRLRSFRKRLGLTQEQAAHELGVAVTTWGRWENGVHEPKGLVRKALDRMLKEERSASQLRLWKSSTKK